MEAAGTVTSGKNLSLLPSSRAGAPLRATTQAPTSFLFLKPQSRNNNARICSGGRVKCAYDYFGNNSNTSSFSSYDGFMGSQQQYPKPTEIQWKKELCNNVQLIGIVATPVQIKQLSSGKALAWSRLAVKKSQNDTIWINLTFWDDLAHVASQHLEKGQQIYVCGRLVSDTVESDDGKPQTYYKVVVQQINFIERGAAPVALYEGESNAPTSGRKQNNNAANSPGSVEELWQDFFANPVEWWDNRKNKRSPNYPDFKHKDTGEALWVQGRYNPPWVKSQLAILDARMESFPEQNGGKQLSYMNIDNLSSF